MTSIATNESLPAARRLMPPPGSGDSGGSGTNKKKVEQPKNEPAKKVVEPLS
jgi:hypothetical protein